MRKMWLIKGKHIIPAYDKTSIENGCVVIEGKKIIEVGRYEDLKGRFRGAEEIGDGSQLIIPGLVNAHHHGRGLSGKSISRSGSGTQGIFIRLL
jgi:cytosine/adenosine deaminase-related metal-dependent hydrolase